MVYPIKTVSHHERRVSPRHAIRDPRAALRRAVRRGPGRDDRRRGAPFDPASARVRGRVAPVGHRRVHDLLRSPPDRRGARRRPARAQAGVRPPPGALRRPPARGRAGSGRRDAPAPSATLDLPGAATMASGLAALVLALASIERHGALSPLVLGALGGAVVLLTAFVANE